MHRQQLELLLTDDLLLQGHWGKEDAAGPAHKFEYFRSVVGAIKLLLNQKGKGQEGKVKGS